MNESEFPKGVGFALRHVSAQTPCTVAHSRFLGEFWHAFEHVFFVIHLADRTDQGRVRAAIALAKTSENIEDRLRYEDAAKDTDATMRIFKQFSNITMENLINSVVNSFHRYLSGIMQAVMLKRPEMLSSRQSVSIEEVLKFRRHKDLVAYLVDKKVNELAYSGLNESVTYIKDRLGIDLFETFEERDTVSILIELRNINVHNGAVVNDLFLKRVRPTQGLDFIKGKRFYLSYEEFLPFAITTIQVVHRIDDHVAKKFRLPQKPHSSWDKRL